MDWVDFATRYREAIELRAEARRDKEAAKQRHAEATELIEEMDKEAVKAGLQENPVDLGDGVILYWGSYGVTLSPVRKVE